MSSAHARRLKEKAAGFPDSPGVYFMKNKKGRVIYVGKAKRLSVRIKSYMQNRAALDAKTMALMRGAETVEYIATNTEVEALVLECTLIKEHRPRYNIRLKDDKRYPYLKITTKEPFPRLTLVRSMQRDGAEYYGPYTDTNALRRMMRTIKAIFPLRDCVGARPGRFPGRACLNFQIGRCRAPCTGAIGEEEYAEIVEHVRLFLRGKGERIGESIRESMWRLAGKKRYEEAAAARDQMDALDRVFERQRAAIPGGGDEDFVALSRESDMSCGVVIKVRDGAILGRESFFIPADASEKDMDVFTAFFELYYHSATDIPPLIRISCSMSDARLAAEWLSGKSGRRVRISTPRKGDKRSLLDLARRNASLLLVSEARIKGASLPVLRELKEALGIRSTPVRIEAYDISNIQGAEAVASMVTFERGAPYKAGYRRFKIRGLQRPDDCAMMREVLSRRLARLNEGKERHPDLIMVDGGMGQVSAVSEAMAEIGITGIPVIGLAKKNEEIYVEGRREPLRLVRRSGALRLLQRVRDEAHRFAIEYHRKLRGRNMRNSALDDVPGIGPARKTALLVRFGDLEGIITASIDEIARVPGIGKRMARKVYESLHKE
ncbi:MAG: excinuclease ABC subunit UvrC [Candidatus Krumholzibacteria bacterium]|nr:excinuclease ABC subunit UvrC [Candidatus Krumholzibacteria bacterium]